MIGRLTFGFSLLVAAAVALGVLACQPLERPVSLETFETVCGDLPCGWTAERGTVEWAETLHAGAHGLFVDGGARATVAPTLTSPGRRVVVVGACYGGSLLLVDGPEVDPADGSTGAIPTLALFDSETAGDYELESSTGTWSGAITALEATPGGGCVVDEIGYVQ